MRQREISAGNAETDKDSKAARLLRPVWKTATPPPPPKTTTPPLPSPTAPVVSVAVDQDNVEDNVNELDDR